MRGLLTGYAIVAILAGWPVLSVLASSLIASWNGCTLHEGYASRCIVYGIDLGGPLYSMGVLGWLMLMTLPLGAIALIGWTVIWLVARKRRVAGHGTT